VSSWLKVYELMTLLITLFSTSLCPLLTAYCSLLTIPLDSGLNSRLYNLRVVAMTAKTNLRSGELARLAGVSTDTLRHYERKGVLGAPRRSRNGYREYGAEALDRVLLVRRALLVGFTLDELARILKQRDGGRAPCREVRQLAASKLAEIEERLKEMGGVRDELRATIKDWDAKLNQTADGNQARLLEALAKNKQSAGRETLSPVPSWTRRKKRRLTER
jgi:DNA-binding transcriptional MerR regulator